MSQHVKQKDLAAIYRKSVPWVSKMQSRSLDPMPRDLTGAVEWGRRVGYLVEETPIGGGVSPQMQVAPVAVAVESAAAIKERLVSLHVDTMYHEITPLLFEMARGLDSRVAEIGIRGVLTEHVRQLVSYLDERTA